MSNIKTWKKRITAPLTNQRNLFMSMQAEIDELRAALAAAEQGRDALQARLAASKMGDEVEVPDELA